MSVELVNGHVLFPNGADWSQKPKWSRAWQTAVAEAVVGRESRYALRSNPRVTLNWRVITSTVAATQMLDDRIRAAVKSGFACAPFHGRGAWCAAEAGDNEVVANGAWRWQAGDYFFAGDENASDARLIIDAALDVGMWTLTLDEPLDFDHTGFAWPLLFGKLTTPDMPALTPRVGPVRLTLSELVSGRSAQIGEVNPDVGAGIGHMIVGSTNVVA